MDSGRFYAQLGSKISRARRDAGLTQGAVAQVAGISRASLANIEAGRQQVFVHHLVEIARALDLGDLSEIVVYDASCSGRVAESKEVRFSGAELSSKERDGVLALLSRASARRDPNGDGGPTS